MTYIYISTVYLAVAQPSSPFLGPGQPPMVHSPVLLLLHFRLCNLQLHVPHDVSLMQHPLLLQRREIPPQWICMDSLGKDVMESGSQYMKDEQVPDGHVKTDRIVYPKRVLSQF